MANRVVVCERVGRGVVCEWKGVVCEGRAPCNVFPRDLVTCFDVIQTPRAKWGLMCCIDYSLEYLEL